MSYTQLDMKAVHAAIRKELPEAQFARWDYDFSSSVRLGEKAIILFDGPREGEDGPETITKIEDVPNIVRALTA